MRGQEALARIVVAMATDLLDRCHRANAPLDASAAVSESLVELGRIFDLREYTRALREHVTPRVEEHARRLRCADVDPQR